MTTERAICFDKSPVLLPADTVGLYCDGVMQSDAKGSLQCALKLPMLDNVDCPMTSLSPVKRQCRTARMREYGHTEIRPGAVCFIQPSGARWGWVARSAH
jgi:hypothetical protein